MANKKGFGCGLFILVWVVPILVFFGVKFCQAGPGVWTAEPEPREKYHEEEPPEDVMWDVWVGK